uniref:GrpE protein homolog n=1 Tax=Ficedula albicollis TaxID=59894 RepID=A0A803V0X5_FICAL
MRGYEPLCERGADPAASALGGQLAQPRSVGRGWAAAVDTGGPGCRSSALRPARLCLTSPRLLCAATQQKNTGQNLEEDQSQSQNEQKVESSSAEKLLAEEKAKLEEQLKDVTDKYKRALADAENVRQRSQKLVEEAKLYGIQSFCKDLLEVADILEKATESVPKEEIKDDNPHLKSLYEGLVMTEMQIQKVFKKHGLIRVDPVGAKFDPYEHEALFHAPVEGQEPGTIALVSKIGYKLHGRTLRPALVGVVKDA